MSSIICYESDNLTIIGAKWEWYWFEPIPTIRLHFSILLNGRIKNLYHEFQLWYADVQPLETLVDWNKKTEVSEKKDFLSLYRWEWWNTLLSTINSLWYAQDVWFNEIQNWIDKLYK